MDKNFTNQERISEKHIVCEPRTTIEFAIQVVIQLQEDVTRFVGRPLLHYCQDCIRADINFVVVVIYFII